MTDPPRPLLSAAEVEAAYGLKAERVLRLARDGAIEHYRLGRMVRFTADQIDAWLTRKRSP